MIPHPSSGRRCGPTSGAAHEHGPIARRADGLQETGFSGAIVPQGADIRDVLEDVIDPGEENVVGGELLVKGIDVEIFVDEGAYFVDQVAGCAIFLYPFGEENDLFVDHGGAARVGQVADATEFDGAAHLDDAIGLADCKHNLALAIGVAGDALLENEAAAHLATGVFLSLWAVIFFVALVGFLVGFALLARSSRSMLWITTGANELVISKAKNRCMKRNFGNERWREGFCGEMLHPINVVRNHQLVFF